MRGEEAKAICPEIVLVTVPTIRDKADLTRYRDAGREVVSVLCKFSDVVQKASVDEAYIDLTAPIQKRMNETNNTGIKIEDLASTFIVGYSDDNSNEEEERQKGTKSWLQDIFDSDFHPEAAQRLAYGAVIIEELRKAVLETTGFKCSAGIAHNKVLAKLACGIHKPNRQTVLPQDSVAGLFATLPLRKVRSLGGKFGEEIEESLGCKFMGDLLKYSEKELRDRFDDKTGSWLYNMSRGYEYEPVQSRLVSKSIGCCKKFPGKVALKSRKDVEHWLNKLSEELLERLLEDEAMYKRRATQIVVSVALEINKKDIVSSKTLLLPSYNYDKIFSLAMGCLRKFCTEDPSSLAWSPPIKYLGLSSGKFSDVGTKTINSFFKPVECKTLGEKTTLQIDLLDDTGSPSFFEKIFLKDVDSKGKERPKLSLLPFLEKAEDDDSKQNCVESDFIEPIEKNEVESKTKTNIKTMFKKIEDKENRLNIIKNDKVKEEILDSMETKLVKDPPKSTINCLFSKTEEKPQIKKAKTIESFLTNNTTAQFNPEEIFPDLNAIDDEILSMLPPNFRKKVIELRDQKRKEVAVHNIDKGKLNEFTDVNKPSTSGFQDVTEKNICNEEFCDSEESNPEIAVLVELTEDIDYKICQECFNKVPVLEYEEHCDFHLATKLQKELNTFPVVQDVKPKIQMSKASQPKKRKSSDLKQGKTNKKVMKSIDCFFKK
ncbi:DNA polymerase eta isoform X2 [Cimex lectularius]|nr:DNA polymerase eta isoform X2 [Cimex lectularius]